MIVTIIDILIGLAIILVAAIGMTVTRNHEKKEYNNGICPKCGGNLRSFDSDSQGGRGYNCDKCNNFVWVSYNVDKPRKEDKK